MTEIWKDIIEASNYAVSNLGQVKNTKTNRLLNPKESGNGYKQVSLKMNDTGKFRKEYVHRLVAKYFIDNSEHKKEVNHKDGNRCNNNADNLEWVTSSENQKHKYGVLKSKTSNRLIGQFTKDGEFIQSYESIISAVKAVGLKSRSGLDNVLYGKAKTAGGYYQKYLD